MPFSGLGHLIATIALRDSGLPAEHPALRARSTGCSTAKLFTRETGRKVSRERSGGWYFEFANRFYPDVDDTAMVGLA
ncbi:MAG: hypothetical protein CM1200mP2_21120 [Planctomycetaceae bacterium]|nr:MAG: hypothetical protein CM1200mP2_21120 [Planctomycetaceae bacterium]